MTCLMKKSEVRRSLMAKKKKKSGLRVVGIKVHKSLLRAKKPEKKTLNFKVLPAELKEIKDVARKYCKGNVTAFVRLAVKNWRPRSKDLVDVRKTTRP